MPSSAICKSFITVNTLGRVCQGILLPDVETRLRYLRDRWAQRLAENPKVKILHSPDPAMAAGIGFVSFRDADPGKIRDALLSKSNILTARMAHEEYDGLPVTPHIYSTVGDIDIFADAVGKELKNV